MHLHCSLLSPYPMAENHAKGTESPQPTLVYVAEGTILNYVGRNIHGFATTSCIVWIFYEGFVCSQHRVGRQLTSEIS